MYRPFVRRSILSTEISAIEIEHDASRALDFAQQNWQVHKTPYDARALLAAAIARGEPAAARPVVDWVAKTRLEDKTIERLIQRLAARG